MLTNADILRADADRAGIPVRTLAQVRSTIIDARRAGSDVRMARLMLQIGRLTDEARAWLAQEYAA